MNNLLKLSGPIMAPVSGITKSVVILLHGYGANGDDLIGLAPALSAALPDTFFVAPNAPYPCPQNPLGGLQWFNVLEEKHQERLTQIRVAASIIDAFIDSELKRLGIEENKLALLGFSQGTMLSLHVGLRRSKSPAGILAYSGRLEAPELLVDEISVRPPVLLIHGEDDPLIPVNLMGVAADSLIKNGVKVDTHNRHGLQHGIDQEGINIGADFLQSVLL